MVSTPVSMPLATTGPVSAATIAKVTRRLLPFLLLMYVLAFLDRANVGFAKKAFQLDTNISDAAFAFGASIFFLGYAVLEVPSNLIMHKVGARAWMCRIMVSWGLLSAAMMFAYSEVTFYIFRFLLGVAEAGFFPGVILYLTYWYPSFARAKATGLFYFGAPLAFILGSPLSGLLLEMNGVGGLTGWQWMFLVEGLLASIVGVWAYWWPCCMDQGCGRNDPDPVLGSCDADGLRASQLQHAVQDRDADVHLGRLTLVRARAQPVADHPFEAADRCLGQRTAVVAGGLLPPHAAVLGNQLQVSVALRGRRLDRLARHRARPRRDDDPSIGMAFDDRAIDIRPIVGSVTCERSKRARDLVEQGANL